MKHERCIKFDRVATLKTLFYRTFLEFQNNIKIKISLAFKFSDVFIIANKC